jgi:regulatory protein
LSSAEGGSVGAERPPPSGRGRAAGAANGRRGRARSAGSEGAVRERGSEAEGPDADPVAVAREICLRLLTERARTREELAQALRKRGVPDEAAGAVLERFDEVGLIDDAAFAGQWVRSRHTQRGLARRAIAVELRRKGVADDVAQEALAEVDADSEERRARELVDRKLRTMPADTPDRRTVAARKLVGMLARRGYPGSIAYRVVREALAAHGAAIDELGTEPDA